MSYKLEKTASKKQIDNFKSEYGQNCYQIRGYSMAIVEDSNYYYALEPWEKFENGKVIDNTKAYTAAQFKTAKIEKLAENNKSGEIARTSQEFTLTIQEQECIFDTKDRTQVDLLTAFGVTSTGVTYDGWITNNGIELNLTAEDVATISQTFREKANIYSKWKTFYDTINTCTTIAELDDVVIDYSGV